MIDKKYKSFIDFYYGQDVMNKFEAMHKWYTEKCTGKNVICASDGSGKSGSYKVTVCNVYENEHDYMTKMFTISREYMKPGIWFCNIQEFRFDKNGKVYCVVKPLAFIKEDTYFYIYDYNFDIRAGLWFIISKSKEFIDLYDSKFPTKYHTPNYEMLFERFLEYYNVETPTELAKLLFNRAISEDITNIIDFAKKIGSFLNTLTPYELKVNSIKDEIMYGINKCNSYPLLMKKLKLQEDSSTLNGIYTYINRQIGVYYKFVSDGVIEPIEGDNIDKSEVALACREYINLGKKKSKSAANKMEEVLRTHPNLIMK